MKVHPVHLVLCAALVCAACSGQEASKLAREGCQDWAATSETPSSGPGDELTVQEVGEEVLAELGPDADLLASAAARDDRYRPAALAAGDLLIAVQEWMRTDDALAGEGTEAQWTEWEAARRSTQEALHRLGSECRIVTAE